MAAGPDTLVRRLRRLAPKAETDRAGDADLLGRFVAGRDEAAFAALVDRHGPLVLHVCRRVLGNAHDAEDAFQATFLVLARKAGSVRPREALAAWLHGVARRVALKARTARARRWRATGTPPPAEARPDPFADLSARELLELVDGEVQRLPQTYRLPVLLCCLEGRTQDEAARQLGWSPGSVKGRLERGRARLHARLVRRGLTLSAALSAAEVSRGLNSTALVAEWVAPTARAAVAFAVGPTRPGGPAAALAREAVRGAALARLKVPAVVVLAAGLVAAGLAGRRPPEPARPGPVPQARGPQEGWAARASRVEPEGDDGPAGPWPEAATRPIRVTGRVLDPAGRPLAGAKLFVGYANRRCDYSAGARPGQPVPRATSRADGGFAFAFAPAELDERCLDTARPVVVAVADGFGPQWADVGRPGPVDLRLVEDLPVEGRLLDPAGRPVAGARVVVRELNAGPADSPPAPLQTTDRTQLRHCTGPLPGRPPVTTDADGRFQLLGLGRDRLASLGLDGPGLGPSYLTVATTRAAPGPGVREAAFEQQVFPSRTIRGSVRDQERGRPVAGVRIGLSGLSPTAVTDTAGRYELHAPDLRDYVVTAEPPGGAPYFAAAVSLKAGPGPVTADFDLAGGIPLRGRVTDPATGKPPRRAVVTYYPLRGNPAGAALSTGLWVAPASAPVRPDGSYRLPVLPGPGVVLVAASPRDWYASATPDGPALGDSGVLRVTAGGRSAALMIERYHAVARIDPDDRAEGVRLDLAVQPARSVRGTVLGPDGAPRAGTRVSGLTAGGDGETLEGAAFTVAGLAPHGARELTFHHPAGGLGKVVTVRGDEAGPLAVRLEPCGTVTGRLVDRGGAPVVGAPVAFDRGLLSPRVAVRTGADGRFRVRLVAGPGYFLSTVRPPRTPIPAVAVESGREADLGDLALDK